MRIYLVRHGQSLANIDHTILSATADHRIHLSPLGKDQAREAGIFLSERLPAERKKAHATGPVRLWLSPYTRTRETAAGVMEGIKNMVESTREHVMLCEQQMGIFSGLTDSEMQALFPHELATYTRNVDQKGRFWARPPQGESWFDVAQRVCQVFDLLRRDAEKSGVEDVVIVSHYVAIHCFIMMWTGRPYEWVETVDDDPYPNCGIHMLEDDKDHGLIFRPASTQR